MMALWIICIADHRTIYDHLMLLSISSIYAVLRILAAAAEPLHRHKRRVLLTSVVLGTYAVLAILFVAYYNILPFLDRFWYGFPERFVSSVYVLTVFVLLPSVYLFNEIYLSMIRNTELDYVTHKTS